MRNLSDNQKTNGPQKEIILCIESDPIELNHIKTLLEVKYKKAWILSFNTVDLASKNIKSAIKKGYELTVVIIGETSSETNKRLFLGELKNTSPKTKTINLVTESDFKQVIYSLNEKIIDHCIQKPISHNEFMASVKKLRDLSINQVCIEKSSDNVVPDSFKSVSGKQKEFDYSETNSAIDSVIKSMKDSVKYKLSLTIGPLEDILSQNYGRLDNRIQNNLIIALKSAKQAYSNLSKQLITLSDGTSSINIDESKLINEMNYEIKDLKKNFFNDIDYDDIKDKKKILVVDSSSEMKFYIQSVLSIFHRVNTSSNEKQAVSDAEKISPDLIICGSMQNDSSSYKLVETIKKNKKTKNIPLIFISDYTFNRDDSFDKYIESADDYISFPFSAKHLLARVKNVLSSNNTKKVVPNIKEQDSQNSVALENGLSIVNKDVDNSFCTLTTGICHEINNPNNYVLTNNIFVQKQIQIVEKQFLNLLKNSRDSHKIASFKDVFAEIKESLRWIKEGGSKIKKIVDSLSALSQESHLKRFSTNLNYPIESAISTIKMTSSVNFKLNWRKTSLPIIKCDAYGIKQVFVQLLQNAVSAVKDNEVIEILTRSSKTIVKITIVDKGCGIASDVLPKVFEPFFTTRSFGEGVGLGLTICKNIIEGHGGKITINSKRGEGTRVTFELPRD